MRIPSRHVAKPVEPPKEARPVERIVEVKDNSEAILAEIKKVLSVKHKAPKYVFSILRDSDGLMTEVVATPVEFDTII